MDEPVRCPRCGQEVQRAGHHLCPHEWRPAVPTYAEVQEQQAARAGPVAGGGAE